MGKTGRGPSLVAIAGVLVVLLAMLLLIGVVLMWRSATVFDPDPASLELAQDDGFPRVDWDYWQSVNPDVIGWVSIPDTTVNFPVMKASPRNPDFYLDHDVHGNWSLFGVPFLDADCQGLNGEVAIIYGHHMDDGSMFAPLERYLDSGFLLSHSQVLVQTPTHKMRLRALGCSVKESRGSKRIEFSDDEEFHAWLRDCLGSAKSVDEDALLRVEAEKYERVTILCTCVSSAWTDQRILLYAG